MSRRDLEAIDPRRKLETALRRRGLRLTSGRRAVIEQLAVSNGHLSADELVARLQAEHAHVSRMTVYRTLDLLHELGEIRPTYQGTGAARYVILEHGAHHHFICNHCGIIFDFSECAAEQAAAELVQAAGLQVTGHYLALYGLCQQCQQASPPTDR